MKKATIISSLIIFLTGMPLLAAKCIREIKITRLNVFDRELENKNNFIFSLANKIHVVTRDNVIRREMLMRSGDEFTQAELDESVRNIRNLSFIGEAEAEITEVGADSVDIEIITEDLWTTVAGLSSEGGGGLYSFTIYADEKNIAGMGMGIETEARFSSDDNDGFSIIAYDPRFFGTRNRLTLYFSDLEFQDSRYVSLSKPFYSTDTRYTYSFVYDNESIITRLFSRGYEVYRYKNDYVGFSFGAGRAFGRYTRFEPYINYVYAKNDYSLNYGYDDIGIVPEDETFSGPGIGFRLMTHRYVTAQYLDEFGTIEDLKEHATLQTSIAWSGNTFDATRNSALASIEIGFFKQTSEHLYAGFKNTYSSYYDGNMNRDRIFNTMRGVVYVKPTEYHILAVRAIAQYAWRQNRTYQLTLGGDNGLRGYPDRYLNGTRRFLSNVEYRYFTPIKVLTVGLGGAVFFDAGNIWGRNENIDIADIKTDAGIGLRFGLTKSSTARIIRVDLARALSEDNWYIAFGTENLFSLDRYF